MTAADRILVLVHAFPFGPGMWAPQVDAFPGWRVVTPPLPGFDGHPLAAERTMDAYAQDVLAGLDAMRIERAVFCGLSLGGYVLFGVLRQAPHRVAGLVLADTRTSIDTPDRRAARQRSVEVARTQGAAAIADEMLPNVLGATTRAGRPDVVAHARSLIEAQPAETIAAGLEAMMDRPDSSDVLRRVACPTAIVVGEEDTVTPVSDAGQMHALVTGSTLATIPRAGHMANLEAPAAFNDAVRALLARLP